MERWLQKHVWAQQQQQQPQDDQALEEKIPINKAWLGFLQMSPFLQKKLLTLLQTVAKLRASTVVYPPEERVFSWSWLCNPTDVKVIILGQDPYHGGQATGLAFSVSKGVAIPPSLRNIFLEVAACDSEFAVPRHGCLDNWAKQGVLLLNTILTVEKGKPGSHGDLGWTWFTNYIISCLSNQLDHCVFMLWGSKAIEKANLINTSKHLVLKSQHPSPLAARSNRPSQWPKFLGCGHFRAANEYLGQHGKCPVDWNLD
nr:uracil-DNA glycosylase [Equid gammaherpesvirus 5]UTK45586.1 uracil-DNA glycosylase [Equid gammaherpesvirus 5]UTK45665.1 uracil-DNA glycosylase [Equid gammaherpesvirus 5]UTK45744.1 uracil-DNA glycosylase [Equid gammaherpesvirus 5]